MSYLPGFHPGPERAFLAVQIKCLRLVGLTVKTQTPWPEPPCRGRVSWTSPEQGGSCGPPCIGAAHGITKHTHEVPLPSELEHIVGVWGASRSGKPRVAGPLAWIPTEEQRGLVRRPSHVFPPGFCPLSGGPGRGSHGRCLTWVRAGDVLPGAPGACSADLI